MINSFDLNDWWLVTSFTEIEDTAWRINVGLG